MLKLKGVSKFYYNKGVVASGFSKIDLDLNIGEFVAITGESGSGKSTLLNVISGLDTYEEGEMYINGEETSYYGETDFESYRKKYIANIFQNFNLVNSYTVYQNIELAFLLNGSKTKEVKTKILDLLKEVDMYKYRNTLVSKLSGGQKQRVAIARALAKETPIIVADEPTGNLDTRSAESIMKLLHDISKNKLVIIVTHNYEQVSEYATRKIKMHDGKILEDKVIKKARKTDAFEDKNYGNIIFLNKIKLGFRNTFNIVPKFLLLLIVYLFLTVAAISEYSSVQKSDYDKSLLGYNQYFNNTDAKRILIQKDNKEIFTDEDIELINHITNIDYVVENDLMLDLNAALFNDSEYLSGKFKSMSEFTGTVDVGRMPNNENEVIIEGTKDDYTITERIDEILDKEFTSQNADAVNNEGTTKVIVVGIKYISSPDNVWEMNFYVSDSVINNINRSINKNYSNNKIILNDNKLDIGILPSDKVEKGKVLVPEDISYSCKDYYCRNNIVNITIENIYYKDNLELSISNTYNKNNFERLTGYKEYNEYELPMYLNTEDYYSLYDKGNYQISAFVNDVKDIKDTINELENNNYNALYLKDTLVDYTHELNIFVNIIKLIGITIVFTALFFISYFIVKIIFKSRNIYFSTIRILGATKKDAKMLLNIELNVILNIAYIIAITAVLLINNNIINNAYMKDLISYLKITDYVILYIVLFIMSVFIANRFSKKLFKKSAMKTYRDEV